jgi:integrase
MRRMNVFGRQVIEAYGDMALEDITTDHLVDYVERCAKAKNSDSTINAKLSFWSSLLDEFTKSRELRNPVHPTLPYQPPMIPWRPRPKQLKWWLTKELLARMLQWCRDNDEPDLGDYINFVCHTGCRVEETLRLQRHHFDLTQGMMTIPGTKTALSQGTVPMMAEALEIVQRRLGDAPPDAYLFTFTPSTPGVGCDVRTFEARNYENLKRKWARIRDMHQLHKVKTATLKALRRTFARFANDRGMPTEMLQQYLRHGDINTTTGYLRLVGGYNLDAMRRFLV